MINLVKLSEKDVDKILKLESDFKDAWNKSMLESAFNQERFHCFGLVEDDKLVSVCYINLAGKDADLESIYTLKEHRKKGYAKILLDSVIDFIKSSLFLNYFKAGKKNQNANIQTIRREKQLLKTDFFFQHFR